MFSFELNNILVIRTQRLRLIWVQFKESSTLKSYQSHRLMCLMFISDVSSISKFCFNWKCFVNREVVDRSQSRMASKMNERRQRKAQDFSWRSARLIDCRCSEAWLYAEVTLNWQKRFRGQEMTVGGRSGKQETSKASSPHSNLRWSSATTNSAASGDAFRDQRCHGRLVDTDLKRWRARDRVW